jgi:hypothetical protein
MRRTRLSTVQRWRKDFVKRLEGMPISETVIVRKRTVDGETTIDAVRRRRSISKKGAEKLMKIVEDTIEEHLKK